MELVLRGFRPFNSTRTPKPCAIAHENGLNHEFLYGYIKLVLQGPDRSNPPRTPKKCAITHEKGQKWPKSRVLYDFVRIVLQGPGPFKSTPHPKTVCYSPRKRLEMAEIASFLRFIKACYRVPERLNPPRTAKPCAIAHENGQKWPKSRVFDDFMRVVLRGAGPFKSTPGPKTVCYIPRKRPEMA